MTSDSNCRQVALLATVSQLAFRISRLLSIVKLYLEEEEDELRNMDTAMQTYNTNAICGVGGAKRGGRSSRAGGEGRRCVITAAQTNGDGQRGNVKSS